MMKSSDTDRKAPPPPSVASEGDPNLDDPSKKQKMEDSRRPALFLDVDGVLNSFFHDFLQTEEVCQVLGISRDPNPYCFVDRKGNFRTAGGEFVERVLEKAARDFAEFPCAVFSNHPKLAESAEQHKGFMIRRLVGAPHIIYNPAIISRLGRILKDSALQLDAFWCTSWRERAPKLLAPVFGFPDMPDALVASEGSKSKAVRSMDPNRPLVWLEDEETWLQKQWLQERAGPTLAICPDRSPGLTEKQLSEVEEFLRDPFAYHARHGARFIAGAELEDLAAVEAALKDTPDDPGVLDVVLWACIEHGWEQLAEQVLEKGPPLTMKPSGGKQDGSIVGGAVNKLPSLVPKLIAAGAAPNDALAGICDGHNKLSPSNAETCSWLLATAGAKPTARHLVALLGKRPSPDLVQKMVAAGAPVDIPAKLGEEDSDAMARDSLPLHRAIVLGCDEAILSVLLKGGAPIDQTHGNKSFPSHDYTALYRAVAEWDFSAVRFLLKEGADATRVFSGNMTLLHVLARSWNWNASDETGCRIAELLLDHGASAKGLLGRRHSGGELMTALEHLEKKHRPKLAAVLRSAADRADGS